MKNLLFLSLILLVIMIASCSDQETDLVQTKELGMVVPGANGGNSKLILFKNGATAIPLPGNNWLDEARPGEAFLFTFRKCGTTMKDLTEIDIINAVKAETDAFAFPADHENLDGRYGGEFNETHIIDSTQYSKTGEAFLWLGQPRYDFLANYYGEDRIGGRGAVETDGSVFKFYNSLNPPAPDIILDGYYTGGLYGNESYGYYLYLHRFLENGGEISYNLLKGN